MGIKRILKITILIFSIYIGFSFCDVNAISGGSWIEREGKYYYLDAQTNEYLTGWQELDGETYYFDSDTKERYHDIHEVDGKKYFFGITKGKVMRGWLTYNGLTYYMNPETGVMSSGVTIINNIPYFFGIRTNKLMRGMINYNGDYFYTNSEGILQTGLQLINGKYYYFGSDYKAYTGWHEIDGETYYFDSDTKQRYHDVTEIDGIKYFFGIKYGKLQKGWVNYDGLTYYADLDTGILASDWTTIDGKRYFFGLTKKKMMKGWVTYPTTQVRYYLDPDTGVGVTGWREIDGSIYYFNENSTYITGSHTIDGIAYLFYEDGRMKNDFITIDGNTYYCYEDGTYANDWTTIGGTKYFFNSLGHMIGKNVRKVIDVSAHQGSIDWDTVAAYGDIDGVILRIAAGCEREDTMLSRNIAALKRLGIPYGIYIYSYAENYFEGGLYAQFTLDMISKYAMNPTLGIYFDLESNTVTQYMGVAEYTNVVRGYMDKMNSAGYGSLSKVYTYTSYANTALNSEYIRGLITWIAQYYHYCTYSGTYNAWQYSSTEKIPGINGNVDVNVWF